MGKKKRQQPEQSRDALSKLAVLPTGRDGFDAEDPFSRANYKHMKGLLMHRVNASRYLHSISVAKTARKLARAYGYDEDVARMTGLLHDWDKALQPTELSQRIATFNLNVPEGALETMPWILHGPTAAAVLKSEFPEFGQEVFQAIDRHTVGAPDMQVLDMIVFVADKIEPTHEVPVYQRLYKQIGRISLEEMFCAVLKAGLDHLVQANKPISFETVQAWNAYAAFMRKGK